MADLTDCTCGWGGVHDPDNPRCAAHGADPIDWKARHDDLAAAVRALADELDYQAALQLDQWAEGVNYAAESVRALLADPAAVLADRDRRMKAEAWDVGYEAGYGDAEFNLRGTCWDADADEHPHANPYRAEGGRADD